MKNFSKRLFLALTLPLTISLSLLNADRISVLKVPDAIAQVSPNIGDQDSTNLLQARSLMLSGFPEEGMSLYNQVLEQVRERDGRLREANLAEGIAENLELQGLLQYALIYYQRAFAIYSGRTIVPDNYMIQVTNAIETANNVGSIYLALGQTQQAIAAYQQALEIDRRADYTAMEPVTLSNLGTAYRIAGQTEQALAFYQQAIAAYEETGGNPNEAVEVFNQMGMVYQGQRQFDQALFAYHQGLASVAEQSDEQVTDRILTLENISSLYQAQGQTEQAASYAQQAENALTQASVDAFGNASPAAKASFLRQLGEFYLIDGQPERAKSYFDRAVAIVQQLPDRHFEVFLLREVLEAYTRRGQQETALPYQEQLMEIVRRSPEQM